MSERRNRPGKSNRDRLRRREAEEDAALRAAQMQEDLNPNDLTDEQKRLLEAANGGLARVLGF